MIDWSCVHCGNPTQVGKAVCQACLDRHVALKSCFPFFCVICRTQQGPEYVGISAGSWKNSDAGTGHFCKPCGKALIAIVDEFSKGGEHHTRTTPWTGPEEVLCSGCGLVREEASFLCFEVYVDPPQWGERHWCEDCTRAYQAKWGN